MDIVIKGETHDGLTRMSVHQYDTVERSPNFQVLSSVVDGMVSISDQVRERTKKP
jgi:hypothetical protein